MALFPSLDIDINKIENNSRILVDMCAQNGITIAGVTKVVCGHPKVARAMLRSGVVQIADSRIENIRRMRDDGIRAEMLLLRLPMLSHIQAVVRYADISLNSEITTISALSDEALRMGKIHRVILMIDLGDLREGILPEESLDFARNIIPLKGVELAGIGTNLACLSGVQPDHKNMELLVDIAHDLRQQLSIPLPIVSGGNGFALPMLVQGELPEGINHLRLGASIIMNGYPTPSELNLHSDTMCLHTEILELKAKPSRPYGVIAENAFGKKPVFKDKGVMQRAVLGIGEEDIDTESLIPVDPEVKIIGASSDHLVVDVSSIKRPLKVGGELKFHLEYSAVLAAMTSKYVDKNLIYQSSETRPGRVVNLLSVPGIKGFNDELTRKAPASLMKHGLMDQIRTTGFLVEDIDELEEGQSAEKISEFVASRIQKNVIPVVIGGPHAVILHELVGIEKAVKESGLICFDAHGDIMTYLLDEQQQQPTFSFENYVIIGVRDLTNKEKEILQKSSITVFTMEDIDRLGMVEVMRKSLDKALRAVDGVHVSIDMDFVDMNDAPGVATPEPGGTSFREAHLAMEMIAETEKLISLDLVEIAPASDPSGKTTKLGISLIRTLLGKRLLVQNNESQL